MGAGAWQADDAVPNTDLSTVDDLGLLHYTDAKTRQVVFAVTVKAWHFCGLTAEPRRSQPASSHERYP